MELPPDEQREEYMVALVLGLCFLIVTAISAWIFLGR